MRAAFVDELIAVETKLKPFEADIKRREALKKTVRTWPALDEVKPEESKLYQGTTGSIALGPAENERKFKKGALSEIYKALGLERFIAAVSLTLKNAETMLGDRLGEFIYEERSGSRPITVLKAS